MKAEVSNAEPSDHVFLAQTDAHGFHPGPLTMVASQSIFQARCLTARLPARLPASLRLEHLSIPNRRWIRPGPSDKCDNFSAAGFGVSLLVRCPPKTSGDQSTVNSCWYDTWLGFEARSVSNKHGGSLCKCHTRTGVVWDLQSANQSSLI